ncbi:MAG: FTR1 family protein [Zhongshania sp.]|uniref:FTR1 family protein n=1 Tax=Zhongshania sp. TaxID=1971902 RepID=UPI00262068CA|nr:FTR1 family protein [Zhongshania sp.]MDF1692665.1 FTR1 family protein [Zhongshania sp.]
MLLTSVVIIIREVLEAALLISILLSMCRQLSVSQAWFKWGVLAGLLGSVLYGSQMGRISQMWDGVGQELSDATIQVLIYFCLLYSCRKLLFHLHSPHSKDTVLLWVMAAAIALAVIREGSEIYIYLSAFQQSSESRMGLYSGSAIGLGIGFSFCALFYYWLLSFSSRRAVLLGCGLLTLVAGGMVLQGCKMLTQADWLPDGQTWDSSSLLPEDSLPGQLLYAMMGYEASPSPAQVAIYAAAILLMLASLLLSYWRGARSQSALTSDTE